jgi:hypothetical protein
MQRYELGGWILVAAAAVFGCGSSDAVVGAAGGASCTANAACSSGLCLAEGACAIGKPGGGKCTSGADCASGVCQGGACEGNGQGAPSTAACTSNATCASGTCTSGACASGSVLPDGKSCSSSGECASGACTHGVCGTGTGIGGGTGGAGNGTSGAGNGTSGAGNGTSGAGNGTSGAGNGTSGAGNGTSGAGNGKGGAVSIVDGGKVVFGSTQCTDGIDNDGDGLIDSADPECTGPLDNDESSFATGIPGDNIDACKQDCFFDGNSGQGDDGCNWELKCDPLSPGGAKCPYDPNYRNCPTQQSQKCIDFCTKLTPNGCDCFGCCTVPLPSGGTIGVILANSCSLANIGDASKCPRCTPTTSCTNTCQRCELCVGKDTLPADCATPPGTGGVGNAGAGGALNAGGGNGGGVPNAGGAPNTGGSGGSCAAPICPSTTQACGVSCLPACPTGEYCLTGCCIQSPR